MDDTITRLPPAVAALRAAGAAHGFTLSCEERTGALLAVLAAARPGGRILELGTGVGEGTAWLLSGMDADARLVSVELDGAVQDLARAELGGDGRCAFVAATAGPGWRSTAASPSTSSSPTPGRASSPTWNGPWTWSPPAAPT
ncbi:hypothetical protein ACFQ1I_13765 [Kitasatospora arboriphila]